MPSPSNVHSARSTWQKKWDGFLESVKKLLGVHRRCQAYLGGIASRLIAIRNENSNPAPRIEQLALDVWKMVTGRAKSCLAISQTAQEREQFAQAAFQSTFARIGQEIHSREDVVAFVAGTLKAAATVKGLEPAWMAAGLRAFLGNTTAGLADPQTRRAIVDELVASEGRLQARSSEMRAACGTAIADQLPARQAPADEAIELSP